MRRRLTSVSGAVLGLQLAALLGACQGIGSGGDPERNGDASFGAQFPTQENASQGRDGSVADTATQVDAAGESAIELTLTATERPIDLTLPSLADAGSPTVDASVLDARAPSEDAAATDAASLTMTECSASDCTLTAPDAAPSSVDAAADADAPLPQDCAPGQERPCPLALGACATGVQTCASDGLWSPCSVAPAAQDTCLAGDDSDCDGVPNTGCACLSGQTATCGELQGALGSCSELTLTCSDSGVWEGSCEAVGPDSCEAGNDADCDGVPNEGCQCAAGATSTCSAVQGAQGACAARALVCSSAGQWQGDCEPTGADTCSAGNDNDCDGEPNEGCRCVAGATSTCGAAQGAHGVCASLPVSCTASGNWSGSCAATSAELCDRAGLDEDCDGQSNEPESCNTPPQVTITTPSGSLEANYDGYDEARGMWYATVRLVASASDAEDGTLTGAAIRWTTSLTSVQSATLGTGETLSVRLYSDDCFGATHVITAHATDSFGAVTSSATRSIYIYTLC